MDPEKLKEIIQSFCKELYSDFKECPSILMVPGSIWECAVKLLPDVSVGDGESILLNFDWGKILVRKG